MAKGTPKRRTAGLSPTVDTLPADASELPSHPQDNAVSNPGPPMYDLQDFICNQNPYTVGSNEDMTLPENFKDVTTIWDGWTDKPHQFIYWFFPDKDGPQHLLRVSKALRIPYTYVAEGKTVTEYLLIGYEGAGGY